MPRELLPTLGCETCFREARREICPHIPYPYQGTCPEVGGWGPTRSPLGRHRLGQAGFEGAFLWPNVAYWYIKLYATQALGRGFTDLGPTGIVPSAVAIPCPPLVSSLQCPVSDRPSALAPTRGLGTLFACGKGFSALLAIWATLFLLASPLCKMLLCSSAQCSGVSKTRARYPGH